MNSLDLAVSSAIMRLHALERALHDTGPWMVEYAGGRVPAERFVLDDGVTFVAEFPSSDGPLYCSLFSRNDFLMTFVVTPPDDGQGGPFIADVAMRLDTSVVV